MTAPVVFVDIKQGRSLLPRPQKWYWIAKSATNQKVLARSSERYTNRTDCIAAVRLLFSSAVVYQRESEKGTVVVRVAAP